MRTRGLMVAMAGTLSLAAGAATTWAATLTFEFGGTITSVYDPNNLTGVVVGQPWVLTYTFDSAAPDSDPNPHAAVYAAEIGNFQIGSTTFGMGPGVIVVWDDYPGEGFDEYGVRAQPSFVDSGDMLALLHDSSGSMFSSTALPLTPPSVGSADIRRLTLQGSDYATGSHFYIEGTVDSLTPEPTSFSLVAVAGLALMRRR
jgi:hypothetical protein